MGDHMKRLLKIWLLPIISMKAITFRVFHRNHRKNTYSLPTDISNSVYFDHKENYLQRKGTENVNNSWHPLGSFLAKPRVDGDFFLAVPIYLQCSEFSWSLYPKCYWYHQYVAIYC